jgi:hypothetical protein
MIFFLLFPFEKLKIDSRKRKTAVEGSLPGGCFNFFGPLITFCLPCSQSSNNIRGEVERLRHRGAVSISTFLKNQLSFNKAVSKATL